MRSLLEIPHVEAKVFDSGKVSFHTKAHLIERESGLNTAIIGSSNLSYSALKTCYEWNAKQRDAEQYSIYWKAKKAFEHCWNDERAIPIDEAFIKQYEEQYANKQIMLVNPYSSSGNMSFPFCTRIIRE